MEYMGEEYFKLKASIIKYERFILRVRFEPICLGRVVMSRSFPFFTGLGVLCACQEPSQGEGNLA